jgi:hypothetical protein
MNDVNPDFVVCGETRNYNYEKIEHAVHLVLRGARLIGTNVDLVDRMHNSFVPACGYVGVELRCRQLCSVCVLFVANHVDISARACGFHSSCKIPHFVSHVS